MCFTRVYEVKQLSNTNTNTNNNKIKRADSAKDTRVYVVYEQMVSEKMCSPVVAFTNISENKR